MTRFSDILLPNMEEFVKNTFAKFTNSGHSRSDGTLNPSGVRFGSAEIYNVLDSREDIADLLCVGQSQPGSKVRVARFERKTFCSFLNS